MIDLAGYRFEPSKACIVCGHVIDGAPILAVAHDDDGDLQFTCGEAAHTAADWHLVGLVHFDQNKQALAGMPAVDPGFAALRDEANAAWKVAPVE